MDLYKQFMSEPVEPAIESEMTSLLFQTDWLRVLMVRKNSTPGAISIDAEISFPVETNSDLRDDRSDTFLRNLVLRTIKHLEFLLALANRGYKLGIIGESCLWTASKQFASPPTMNNFEVLLSFQK
jgi:hypothetical protein